MPTKNPRGYMQVRVKFQGIYRTYKAAKLVALHFIGSPSPGEVLLHKNGITHDDTVTNLAYVPISEAGKRTAHKSSRSRAVMKLERETMELVEEYRSAREAARHNFMSRQAMLDRCSKKRTYDFEEYIYIFSDQYQVHIEQFTL